MVSLQAHELINLILVIGGGLLGWFIKELFGRITGLERKDDSLVNVINDLRVELPERYVTKEEHYRAMDEIRSSLQRIENRLNKE